MINILKNDLNNEDDNNCNLNKQDDDPLLSSLPPLPILPLPQPDLKPQVSLLSCNRATIYDDHVKLLHINQTKPKQSFSSGSVVPTGS